MLWRRIKKNNNNIDIEYRDKKFLSLTSAKIFYKHTTQNKNDLKIDF